VVDQARARALGLEERAARILREDDSRRESFSEGLRAAISNERLQLGFLAQRGGSSNVEDAGDETGLSVGEAVVAIIKSVIGPGILYVPKGFSESGVCFAVPMLVISYFLVASSSVGMLHIGLKHKGAGYTDLAGRAFGPLGSRMCKVLIVAQQCGICLTYFIFVATNVKELIFDFTSVDLSLR
jgi:hypothetical protein